MLIQGATSIFGTAGVFLYLIGFNLSTNGDFVVYSILSAVVSTIVGLFVNFGAPKLGETPRVSQLGYCCGRTLPRGIHTIELFRHDSVSSLHFDYFFAPCDCEFPTIPDRKPQGQRPDRLRHIHYRLAQ